MIGVFFFSGCAVGLIEPCGGNNLDELQNGNFRVILQFMLHLIFEYWVTFCLCQPNYGSDVLCGSFAMKFQFVFVTTCCFLQSFNDCLDYLSFNCIE